MKIKSILALSLLCLGSVGVMTSCGEKTNDDEKIQAEQALAKAKSDAKTNLDTYAASCLARYGVTDDGTVAAAVTTGKAAIDAVNSVESVNVQFESAKDSINAAAETIFNTYLANVKSTAKTGLDTYATTKLTAANKDDDGTVASAVAAGKVSIDAATTTDAVTTAETNAKAAIDAAVDAILADITIWMVGDSTMCEYKPTDDSAHIYKRYGYGTQMSNYFKSSATIQNLALSGRTTTSFKAEDNYSTLTSGIKAGDYLVIGFAHNDQKVMTTTELKENLKNDYIKVAKDAGATPILATPIVRANSSDDYTGSSGHVTAGGDYAQAVRDLATEENVTLIDLTATTKAKYTEIGYAEALNYHAIVNGKYDEDGVTVVPDYATTDTTHLNIYGAKEVAYMFATELKKTTSALAGYVLDDITEPTKEKDLPPIAADYVVPTYDQPDLAAYKDLIDNGEDVENPDTGVIEHKSYDTMYKTITTGWYGTAFGDMGGDPKSTSNENFAKEVSEGVFHVGNATKDKGKFASGADGMCMVFSQIPATKNFTISASAKVLTTGDSKQAGFGLMVRDDIRLLENIKTSGQGNYLAAGFVVDGNNVNTNVIFSRESATAITKSDNVLACPAYAVDDTAEFTINRTNNVFTATVVFKGQTYTETYYDFQANLMIIDSDYMYVGMFANRKTSVEYTNVQLTIGEDAII